jgi:hypothetical protein
MKIRLKPDEAKFLKLEIKKHDKYGNPKYTINELQNLELQKFRFNKVSKLKGTSVLLDANGNVKMQWIKRDEDNDKKIKALRIAVNELKSEIIPAKPVKLKNKTSEMLCNQYTLTDYHLGMMSWDEESGDNWDLKIAEQALINYFSVAISNSPNSEVGILANIGDFLHWDGLEAVTPQNKHILDADTRFTKLVRVSIRVIKSIIKMLLEKHKKVIVIMAEGNHDPASSIWLRELFSSFYENEPRVFVDTNPDIYYCFKWGNVCLFYHHGHKRNVNNSDTVFVSKFKKEFGESDFVYAHLGHLHNQQVKETNLMIVEQHRTLASKDAYASRGGWSSGRDANVITYHKNYGEVGRLKINDKMIL